MTVTVSPTRFVCCSRASTAWPPCCGRRRILACCQPMSRCLATSWRTCCWAWPVKTRQSDPPPLTFCRCVSFDHRGILWRQLTRLYYSSGVHICISNQLCSTVCWKIVDSCLCKALIPQCIMALCADVKIVNFRNYAATSRAVKFPLLALSFTNIKLVFFSTTCTCIVNYFAHPTLFTLLSARVSCRGPVIYV